MVAATDQVGRLRRELAKATLEGLGARFEHLRRRSVFTVEHLQHVVVEACGGPGAGSLELQGLVASHGARPRREVGAKGVSRRLAAHGQERFLDDVLGVAQIRFDRQDVIQHHLLVLDEESLHLQGVVGGGGGVSHTQETARGGGLISIRKTRDRATA